MKKLHFFLLTLLLFAASFLNAATIKSGSNGGSAKNSNDKYFGNFKEIAPDKIYTLETDKEWYKNVVFYHIWVKAFADSNGDGVGDLNGITSKLDYLKDLGVGAIWLSPIFACDYKGKEKNGNMHAYDTVDYYKVEKEFGTEADLENLIAQAHIRDIKIIFDYVVNHTSDKHPWFIDSKNGGAKRNWYIWNDHPNENYGKPWGGGSWQQVWHKYKDSYYYGGFWSGMPDLNMDNPEVREEMANVLVYWLNKGFDGIRIDAARHLFEEEVTRKIDNKKRTFIIQSDSEKTIKFFRNMRKDILDKYDAYNTTKMMVGEVWNDGDTIQKYGGEGDIFHMCFDFPLAYKMRDVVKLGNGASKVVLDFKDYLNRDVEYFEYFRAATFLNNHDEVVSRPMTSFDGNVERVILALATNLFVPGTPFLYYGNEIGMADGNLSGDRKFRTDMDWSSVDTQQRTKNSILNRSKELVKIRDNYKALNNGELITLNSSNNKVLTFAKKLDNEIILVALNYTEAEVIDLEIDLTPLKVEKAKLKEIIGSKLNDITSENRANFKFTKIAPFSFALYSIEGSK